MERQKSENENSKRTKGYTRWKYSFAMRMCICVFVCVRVCQNWWEMPQKTENRELRLVKRTEVKSQQEDTEREQRRGQFVLSNICELDLARRSLWTSNWLSVWITVLAYTVVCTCVYTWAAELLALDLSNSFVGEPSRAGAASTTCLDGIVLQVVCQPFQMAVTDKWVLGQMTDKPTCTSHTQRTQKHI